MTIMFIHIKSSFIEGLGLKLSTLNFKMIHPGGNHENCSSSDKGKSLSDGGGGGGGKLVILRCSEGDWGLEAGVIS